MATGVMRQWRQFRWVLLVGLVLATIGCVSPTYQTVTRSDLTQMTASGLHGPTQWGKTLRTGEFAAELGVGAGVASAETADPATGAVMQGSGQFAAMFGLAHSFLDNVELGFHYRISPSEFATAVAPLPPIPALSNRPTRSWLLGVRARLPARPGVAGEFGGGLGLHWVNYSRFVAIVREPEDPEQPATGGVYTAQGASPALNAEATAAVRVNEHRPVSAAFGVMLASQPRGLSVFEQRSRCVLTSGTYTLEPDFDPKCGTRTAPVHQLGIAGQLFAEVSWRIRMHDLGWMVHVAPLPQSGDVTVGAVLRWRPRWVLPDDTGVAPRRGAGPAAEPSWSPE